MEATRNDTPVPAGTVNRRACAALFHSTTADATALAALLELVDEEMENATAIIPAAIALARRIGCRADRAGAALSDIPAFQDTDVWTLGCSVESLRAIGDKGAEA